MFIEQSASNYSLVKRKLVYGVGINDAWYIVSPVVNGVKCFCPFYRAWSDMITRCYSTEFHKKNSTYADCLVTNKWLTFSGFKKWMTKQEWKGKALDKDLLNPSNKTYAPDNCIFVSQQVNNLLMDRRSVRGSYPIGVSADKRSNRFYSKCATYSKQNYLGSYATPEEASEAYKQFKSKHILEVAEEYKNEPRLYEALKNHARLVLL